MENDKFWNRYANRIDGTTYYETHTIRVGVDLKAGGTAAEREPDSLDKRHGPGRVDGIRASLKECVIYPREARLLKF